MAIAEMVILLNQQQSNRKVFFLLGMVSVLWGVNAVMIKYLTSFFPPLALAPIRLSLATGLLLPVVYRRYGVGRLSRKAFLAIAGVAFYYIFLHQIALTLGLTATSGTHAVLILGLCPLFTALMASFILKEPFTWQKGIGIVLGFSSLLLVVLGRSQGNATLAGDGIMLIATLTFVIGSIYVKKSTLMLPPLVVTAYSDVLASIGLAVLGLCTNSDWFYPGAFEFWPVTILLFSSFVNTALGALWWNMGIQQVGASTASLFQNALPVFGVFASAIFLEEQVSWNHVIALILVLLAVSLGTGVISPRLLSIKKKRLPS